MNLIYLYKTKKMYFRLIISVVIVIALIALFTIFDPNFQNVTSYSIFALFLIAVGIYVFYRIRKIKKLQFYLKTDAQGVYTYESFSFCAWNNIKNIDLRRYMGYQTLFFEVKEENLKSKIKPVHKDGKSYYCLPLADCEKEPKEILNQLKRARRKAKKD